MNSIHVRKPLADITTSVSNKHPSSASLDDEPATKINRTAPSSTKSLEELLVDLVRKLHLSNPHHAIFGSPARNTIRLPYQTKRKNGQGWKNVMIKIAGWVMAEMGAQWAWDNCWMATKGQIQITGPPTGTAKVDVYATITVCRLLAFFANPTGQNWIHLSDQANAESSPFNHRCQRGHLRYDGRKGCINGVFHGSFTTKVKNEGRKLCKYGAVCLCRHTEEDGGKCIFTRTDGTLATCRMVADHVPKCECVESCY